MVILQYYLWTENYIRLRQVYYLSNYETKMQRGQETLFYKSSEACKILGIKSSILKKWDADGTIKTIRTPGNMRLYDISSIDPAINVSKLKIKQDPITILYARVSSSKQRDDLERQKQFLQDNMPDKHPGSKEIKIITDIESGINFKRPGLLQVLGLIKDGNVSKVVVASKDRLARFGFELIEWICNEYRTKILVLDNSDTTPEEELGNDLMAIVQVYCCRWNGRRRYKTKNKDKEVETKPEQGTETDAS